MKNVALVILALGMLACNNSRNPSLVDSGSIVLPDTGTAPRDTGTTPRDTGSTGSTCGSIATSTDTWPALPSGCLPRCTTATGNAYNACITTYQASGMTMADQTALTNCENAAYAADHTATVQVDVGSGMTVPVSCGGNTTDTFGCLEWQSLAAESMVCSTTLGDFITCANGVPAGGSVQTACATQITARNNCITTNMTAFQNALNTLGSACFGG